jgi:dipeptidyl-peptidase 9
LLYFLELNENRVTFIWSSEETGFRHLYLVTSSLLGANGGQLNGVINNTDTMTPLSSPVKHIECDTLVARIINKVSDNN